MNPNADVIFDDELYLSNHNVIENHKDILIIDDDEEVLNWFKSVLISDERFKIHLLKDEMKILDVLQKTNPDLIFMDICLNSISGRQIGEIVQLVSYFKVPIIYMSSRKNWDYGKIIDKNYFLAKPLNKQTVKAKIDQVLGAVYFS